MNKRKILHLITGLEIGGAEMMLLKTLPRLQGNLDNRVCCISGHGPVGKELEKVGIPVYYLDLRNFFDFRIVGKFRKIVKEFKPDILVTYLVHADLFGRIFGSIFGVKKIICSVRIKLIQPKYLPFLFLDGLTSCLVSHYHFNSQTVADMYQRYFFLPKRKITVIPNGLETEKYKISTDKNKKKQELGLPQNKIIIGCVAKLRKQKNHQCLINAFAKITQSRDDVVLLLVGDGEERKNIENTIEKLKIKEKTFLLGNRSDIPEILQIIDIFALPTLFEGMSNAILEAMASGLPVVTTDIPENRELIENGKTGILVPAKNSVELERALQKLINNPELGAKIGNSAKEKIVSSYDIEKIVSKLNQFWASL